MSATDADDIYIIVSGKVEHTLEPGAPARPSTQILKTGDVFGWAALLEKSPRRLAKAVCIEPTEIVRISGDELLRVLATDPDAGDVVMSRFATMIAREYTVPDLTAQLRRIHRKHARARHPGHEPDALPDVAVAQEPAAVPDADRLRSLPGLLVSGGRSLEAAALPRDAGHHRRDQGMAQPRPDLRPVALYRRSTTSTSGSASGA